jgi:hypothetical protein
MSKELLDVKSKEKLVDVTLSSDSTVPTNLEQLRIDFLMSQVDDSISKYDKKQRWNAK